MEKNWFTLYEDTFLWLKGNFGLAYNTANKRQFCFVLTKKIEDICNQLLITENLYTVELTDEDLNEDEINQWMQSIIGIQAGYLTYNVEFTKRPVSLKPILKVQNKKEYYELNHTKGVRGEILQNLYELTFYINGSEYGSNEFFMQHVFPLKDCLVLDSSIILSFIRNSKNSFLSNINLIGNLFAYPDYEKFINDISDFSIQSTIHIMVQDLWDNIQKIEEIMWPSHIQFNILADSIFDLSILQDISLPFSITAFVFLEDDYLQFTNMFEALSLGQNIRFIPLYNKQNLSFFESNVFNDKDDLEQIDLSKNEIFMRQSLNIGNFGKLTVMPDGFVYANVNATFLGTIENSPYSLVYKEFTERKSWLAIRDQVPCKDCIYQWLCPSPSNYETVIGIPNLCRIIPNGKNTKEINR